MKDMCGTEIKVGDKIVACKPSGRRSRHAGVEILEVVRFTPQRVVTGATRLHCPEDVLVLPKVVDTSIHDKELEMLYALEAAGVDNWEGYDYAMEIYRERVGEDDE